MMSNIGTNAIGKTNVVTQELSLGQRCEFPDCDYAAQGVKPELSGMMIEAVLLRNDSGDVLLPSEGIIYSTKDPGAEAGAQWGADSHGHGVVDPFLPAAGVADGETFLCFTRGPVKVIHAGNDTIVKGDALETGAAGRVDKYASAAGKSTARLGIAMETPANNSAGTKFRALIDCSH